MFLRRLFFQIEEAFATLETWQEIAVGLPALVDRLRALETLHLASASFAQRLEQVIDMRVSLGQDSARSGRRWMAAS